MPHAFREPAAAGLLDTPASWTLREPRVRSSQALVSGEVVPLGGGHAIVELSLISAEGDWKIRFWSASNRELCLEAE